MKNVKRGGMKKAFILVGCVVFSLSMSAVVLAYTTIWNTDDDWVQNALCSADSAAYKLECSGDYCDNVRMTCDAPSKAKTSFAWTSYLSEEEGYNWCPSGSVVTGVDCAGSYCDNESLQCTYLSGASLHNCGWVGPFSDETNYGICPGIQYINAFYCAGDYCDDQYLYCCDI